MKIEVPNRLLTKKELAEFLAVDEDTVAKYEKEGIIHRAKGIKSPRYSPRFIAELMEIDLSEFNPFLLKIEQKKNQELEQENAMLRGKLEQIQKLIGWRGGSE